MTNTFDRLGRASTTICSGMTTTFAYNDASELLSETFSGGTLYGLAVTNAYDAYLRRIAVGLNTQPSTLTQFGYDNGSRLAGVTNGYYNAAYAYLANSPLLSQITFRSNTVTRMTTTKSYDFLNRLSSIACAPSASSAVSFSYAYNSANQRTRATLSDGSYWLYDYDSLGQVRSGKKYWYDGTPVAGQQFEYAFDAIGNRTQSKAGGDDVGLSLRESLYAANNLNQYTNRDVPGYVDIMGLSFATNTVTVNSQTAYRKGEYFRKELGVGNGSAPLWTNIIVAATGQTSVTGNLFVAKSPETFGYDADGNMTNDGRWSLTWDAENRLTKVESLSSGPTACKRKVVWEFDCRGRRIRQTTSDGSSGSYVVTEDLKFLSDGWRHIAELNATNNVLVRSYVWGLDLSETMDGAGGVGGLLMLNSAANGAHFYAYDGNGNVTALVKGSDGTVSANYEYDPFGAVLRTTGAMANESRFQFSTKRNDRTTDLALYEHRVYCSGTGCWLSRDPSVESGGPHLYGFVRNRPVDRIDVLGLFSSSDHFELTLNSFNQVSAPLVQRVGLLCAERIFWEIMAANNLQDLLFLGINKRHFNRDYIKGESDQDRIINRWNAVYAYQDYLDAEEREFRDALKDWSLGPFHHKHDCKAALGALGRLSHSWQDFYGHGIHSTGWETGFFLTETPEFVMDFFPSTFAMFKPGAEHPRFGQEPPFSDTEYAMRKYVAEVYVRHQFNTHLRDWLTVCWCDCDSL